MKNYTITVNGIVYEVTVEEGISGGAAPAAPAAPKAAPKAAPAAAPKAAAPAGAAGSVTVVLEAMKMENDIVAPQDGTIATINAAAGDSVEAGAVIATLN